MFCISLCSFLRRRLGVASLSSGTVVKLHVGQGHIDTLAVVLSHECESVQPKWVCPATNGCEHGRTTSMANQSRDQARAGRQAGRQVGRRARAHAHTHTHTHTQAHTHTHTHTHSHTRTHTHTHKRGTSRVVQSV